MLQFFVTLQVLAGSAVDRVRSADRDRGATAVEYGLMVALIAGAIIAIVIVLRDDVIDAFRGVETGINGAG